MDRSPENAHADRQNSDSYPLAPRELVIVRGEFDQTPTATCTECGKPFPLLDELTGAHGRCGACDAQAFHHELLLSSIGEPQGSGSCLAAHGSRDGEGLPSDDGSSDVSAPDRADASCALPQGLLCGASSSAVSDLATASEAVPFEEGLPSNIAGGPSLSPAIFGGSVPPGARLIPFAESLKTSRAPTSISMSGGRA